MKFFKGLLFALPFSLALWAIIGVVVWLIVR
jgi:hypothetical protein